ncbi:hypothetical protein CesoFtcFv8_022805 [Champsocephalus esox]|uniref:Uncharacterized protein n=1 Tax=Champsocephalus esox TaxID=159716 RepID=A0AAN8GHX7_9TELE|nr:hypothetical protein CesoFtcFv8_022805 [Champsocephalus esox]
MLTTPVSPAEVWKPPVPLLHRRGLGFVPFSLPAWWSKKVWSTFIPSSTAAPPIWSRYLPPGHPPDTSCQREPQTHLCSVQNMKLSQIKHLGELSVASDSQVRETALRMAHPEESAV